MVSDADREAYAKFRQPATSAVISTVLAGLQVDTLVDLGAGTGASLDFPGFTRAHLIEKDPNHIQKSTDRITWQCADFTKLDALPEGDLLLASYSLGEANWKPLLPKMVQATRNYIAIIEPGTPSHFEGIRAMRSSLLKLGMHPIAPCPHTASCPMSGGNWCHFSKRVPRSREHRLLKEGKRGFEDEKYSYLLFSKYPHPLPAARILRYPQKRSGHIHLDLCTAEGNQKKIISKKHPEYKEIKKKDWGSEINML